MSGNVAYRLKWQRPKHGANRNAQWVRNRNVSNDSKVRRPSAQHCMHDNGGLLGSHDYA